MAKAEKGKAKDELRDEVLALGGNESDLELFEGVGSDSEVEGTSINDADEDALKRELAKMLGQPVPVKEKKQKAVPEPEVAAEAAVENKAEAKEKRKKEKKEKKKAAAAAEEAARELEQAAAVTAVPAAATEAELKIAKKEKQKKEKKEKQAKKDEVVAEEAPVEAPELEPKPAARPAAPLDSRFLVTPTSRWMAHEQPMYAAVARPAPADIAKLLERGLELLEVESTSYTASVQGSSPNAQPPPGMSRSDQQFIAKILTSGTSSDRLSTLLLVVASSPLHSKSYLEQLLKLSQKGRKEEANRVVRGVVDWWVGDGGGPGRKLRAFADQPMLGGLAKQAEDMEGRGGVKEREMKKERERTLILWAFEDWLKKWFFEMLRCLESMSTDTLPHTRSQAVLYLGNLLQSQPEQEANILRLLVNKLGDSNRGVASKTSHILLQTLQMHPGMTTIVVREVANLVLKPSAAPIASASKPAASKAHVRFDASDEDEPKSKGGKKEAKGPAPVSKAEKGQDHARYYGIVTLNQVMLARNQPEVAQKLLDVYFEVFGDVLGRLPDTAEIDLTVEDKPEDKQRGAKGPKLPETTVDESDSKLVAAVLTGINRAFPYAQLDSDAFKRRLDMLFKITHTSTFNVSIQALMLIYTVSVAQNDVSDRYYRTLYASVLDPRLQHSSKQALYLNLFLKSAKRDPKIERVAAFVKRLAQQVVLEGMDVPFALGAIFVISELLATVPGLRTLMLEATEQGGADKYDGRKREPLYANAQNTPFLELAPLVHHFHPSVALHAAQILNGESVSMTQELEEHSLIRFLDRFVYREAKKAGSSMKGSSMMQPGLKGQDTTGRVSLKKGARREGESGATVSADAFKGKEETDVPVDQRFFHKFFATAMAKEDDMSKAKQKHRSKKGDHAGSDDDTDEESIADIDGSGDEEMEDAKAIDAEEEEGSEGSSLEEEEIWQAMKRTMPKAAGDSDLEADDDESAASGDDEDLEAYNYTSDEEEDEVAKASEEEDEDEAAAPNDLLEEDDFSDIPDFAEDEDDLIGSDEEISLGFPSDDEHDASSKKRKGGEQGGKRDKKRKFGALPTFATAEDYAHLLGDSDDDGM